MAKGEKPVLAVRVDQGLLDRLDALAEVAEVGRAEIVERCLELGLMNSEDFVEWLRSPVKGPLVRLLTLPVLLPLVAKLFADVEVSETAMKLRAGALRKRGKGSTGEAVAPAT